MILAAHPTGNTFARALASALAEERLLDEFHTCLDYPADDGGLRFLPASLRREGSRRRLPDSVKPLARLHPWRELGRLFGPRLGLSALTRREVGPCSVDGVFRALDRAVAARLARRPAARGVYLYEDGAAFGFAAARARGLRCFYDLPIGHWRAMRRLLEAERARWPEWSATLGGFGDSAEKLARKDEELRLADLILVASSFTARTLRDFPQALTANVVTVPYGFPPPTQTSKPATSLSRSRPLKLLFVGGLSQRKGVADVFAVAEALALRVELTVVGRKSVEGCAALDRALQRHRWIPSLPHAEVLSLMREHDVLLFPSLFEGFGLVITEAMSQGTPVITTDRTAGPDIISHGENGWVIEAGSTDALRTAVENLLLKPEQLHPAGESARRAAQKRPWAVYGQELVAAVRPLLASGA